MAHGVIFIRRPVCLHQQHAKLLVLSSQLSRIYVRYIGAAAIVIYQTLSKVSIALFELVFRT